VLATLLIILSTFTSFTLIIKITPFLNYKRIAILAPLSPFNLNNYKKHPYNIFIIFTFIINNFYKKKASIYINFNINNVFYKLLKNF
jgi:hypothetical protein